MGEIDEMEGVSKFSLGRRRAVPGTSCSTGAFVLAAVLASPRQKAMAIRTIQTALDRTALAPWLPNPTGMFTPRRAHATAGA